MDNYKILIVDDEQSMLDMLISALERKKYEITMCLDAEEALNKLYRQKFDIILSDQILTGMSGTDFLAKAKKIAPQVPFILMTGYADVENAVEAVKKGAYSYLKKPFSTPKLLQLLEQAVEESDVIAPPIEYQKVFSNIVGRSTRMRELLELITKISSTNATVLIQGESGTGKELIARAIHQTSTRRDAPFVPINCSVLSENLLENELFGHVKGAFTGATQLKRGLFQEADTGTLFLDEIAEIPASIQTKLLRVIQEKEFKPLGSNEIVHVDVRIIAASNVNLYQATLEKRFREDLYYRLAVIPIVVPPLRERTEDIQDLACYFIEKYGQINGKNVRRITTEGIKKLKQYPWPGNVRELENTIERAIAFANGILISAEDLFVDSVDYNIVPPSNSLKDTINYNIHSAIIRALQAANGNRSQAARILGISRPALYYQLKKIRD